MTEPQIPCPDCGGSGDTKGFACPGFVPYLKTCGLCEGAGRITEEQADWIKRGEIVRAWRLAHDLGQREAALKWGIDPVAFSRMEHGRFDPTPLEAKLREWEKSLEAQT